MNDVMDRLAIKYRLVKYNDKEFNEYLNNCITDEKTYDWFIKCLTNIIVRDPNFIAEMDSKLEILTNYINKKPEEQNIDEKLLINRHIVFNKLKNAEVECLKSEYEYIYLYNLGLPFAHLRKTEYTKVVEDNYQNSLVMKCIAYREGLNQNTTRLKNSLKGNLSTLITINTIVNESSEISPNYLDLFIELSSYDTKKEDFDNSKEYLIHSIYKYKTLMKLRNLKRKQKNIDNDNRILIKKK